MKILRKTFIAAYFLLITAAMTNVLYQFWDMDDVLVKITLSSGIVIFLLIGINALKSESKWL